MVKKKVLSFIVVKNSIYLKQHSGFYKDRLIQ